MRTLFIVLLGYAVMTCLAYLRNVGLPTMYRDRDIALFLAVQGLADLVTNGVLLMAALGTLHGDGVAWPFAVALAVQGGVYTWRLWLSHGLPTIRKRRGGKDEVQDRS